VDIAAAFFERQEVQIFSRKWRAGLSKFVNDELSTGMKEPPRVGYLKS